MAIDDNGTQRPHKVKDYGIEVDFSSLDDADREVSMPTFHLSIVRADAGGSGWDGHPFRGARR